MVPSAPKREVRCSGKVEPSRAETIDWSLSDDELETRLWDFERAMRVLDQVRRESDKDPIVRKAKGAVIQVALTYAKARGDSLARSRDGVIRTADVPRAIELLDLESQLARLAEGVIFASDVLKHMLGKYGLDLKHAFHKYIEAMGPGDRWQSTGEGPRHLAAKLLARKGRGQIARMNALRLFERAFRDVVESRDRWISRTNAAWEELPLAHKKPLGWDRLLADANTGVRAECERQFRILGAFYDQMPADLLAPRHLFAVTGVTIIGSPGCACGALDVFRAPADQASIVRARPRRKSRP